MRHSSRPDTETHLDTLLEMVWALSYQFNTPRDRAHGARMVKNQVTHMLGVEFRFPEAMGPESPLPFSKRDGNSRMPPRVLPNLPPTSGSSWGTAKGVRSGHTHSEYSFVAQKLLEPKVVSLS